MDEVIESLKVRYAHVHPLLFQRSAEKAKSPGELFDILEEMPTQYPIVWDQNKRCWSHTTDLLLGNTSNKK